MRPKPPAVPSDPLVLIADWGGDGALVASSVESASSPHARAIVVEGQWFPPVADCAVAATAAEHVVLVSGAVFLPDWWPPLLRALELGARVASSMSCHGRLWDGPVSPWVSAWRTEDLLAVRIDHGVTFGWEKLLGWEARQRGWPCVTVKASLFEPVVWQARSIAIGAAYSLAEADDLKVRRVMGL